MSGTDTWTWATVTQASPLRIKVDGDTTPLDATTGDLVGSLAVDDRVRVHLHSDGIIVTGLQGGGTPEATSATANTLALRNGSGQLKAADGVAADDVATVGQLGVWQDYTPANTGLTIGNGSIDARYTQQGKTVSFSIYVGAGSTSNITTTLKLGLPVTARDATAVAGAGFSNNAGNRGVFYRGASGDDIYVYEISGTAYGSGTSFTSGGIRISGTYEAA